MSIELQLHKYPKKVTLKDGYTCTVRPLEKEDEKTFHKFFEAIPEKERMFIKHRVVDPKVIRSWCQSIDYGRNLPLLAIKDGKIIGDATLHQQLGGWKRHVGRVSVLIHPEHRGHGVARMLVEEVVDVARNVGLERVEAEFLGEQEPGMKLFAMIGFSHLLRLEDHVKDMQAINHDYILMEMQLKTDEEYAGSF
jgi:GNAT superfamily N-acetyltransferase